MALKSFNAYFSYLAAMEPLGDAERGRLFTALLRYAETGVEPVLRGNERFVFPAMRDQIDRDREKYDLTCEKNRKNARKRYADASGGMGEPAADAKEKDREKDKSTHDLYGQALL